jgi:hypothetical protein
VAFADERRIARLTAARTGGPLVLAAVILLSSSGCAGMSHIARDPGSTPIISTTSVELAGGGQPLEVQLAVPPHPKRPDVLVLYASGDGGWFGSAVDMFRAIGDAGFYAVGLSTKALLHRRSAGGTTPAVQALAADYRAVLARAAQVLKLPPGSRVILTGWSRGASLAVMLGDVTHAPPNTAGIVAIGLTAEEDLNVVGESDDDPDPVEVKKGRHHGAGIALYPLIDDVAPGRSAVIQATGDKYLPAAQARALFGADTALRRFYEVPAKNHRFGGGADEFAASLRASLDWVVTGSPVP